MQSSIDRINAQLARFETVKRFTVLENEFTMESGELTPTQKLKRKVVNERYAAQIGAMFAEG